MRVRTVGVALAAIGALVIPSLASAHVELEPATAPGGDLAHLVIQVPNEQETAATTSVSVKIPDEVLLVRFAPKPGWKRTVVTEKLAQSSTVGDDAVTERVSQVTWSGGTIAPGEFDTFDMSVALPDRPDAQLAFPSVQRYDNGDIVRWIGAEDADEPAPRVTVAAAEEAHGSGSTSPSTATSDTHSGDGKSNAALGFGIAGLAAGLCALALGLLRRQSGPPTT